MQLPIHNLLAWEISATVFHFLVVQVTFLRLVHRWRTERMWWDDYTAFILLMLDVIYVILTWLRFRYGVTGLTTGKIEGFIYSAWFGHVVGWAVVWGSRFSLSLSIARIFPENHVCRRISFGLSIILPLSYVVLLLVSTLICKPSSKGWYDLDINRLNCLKDHSRQLLASYIATDLIADTLLVVTPLVMLWKIKLPTKERRLILALFFKQPFFPVFGDSIFSRLVLCVRWKPGLNYALFYVLVGSGRHQSANL